MMKTLTSVGCVPQRNFLSASLLALVCLAFQISALEPEWLGKGNTRIIVEVPAMDLQGRPSDEMVAAFDVDVAALRKQLGEGGSIDLKNLAVHRLDATTGKPVGSSSSNAMGDDSRPIRFDDHTLPEQYPGRVGHASDTSDGRVKVTVRPRKARLFNRLVSTESGRFIWTHTQEGNNSTRYAIYFDIKPSTQPWQVSPAPWIGDADVLREASGQSIGTFGHFSVATGDFDGDGLFDLLAGTEKGDLMWFPNQGEIGKPRFTGCRILEDEEGPIDVGWYGNPLLFDWDSDGLSDLIVGTSANVILWWKNIGTKTSPKLSYRGFIQADGKRLECPQTPVPENPKIFKRDYYNRVWAGDWDGDGTPDLLAGGYTTGLIFHFRGNGKNADGTPQLHYVGPLEADGKAIDTTWAASPLVADLDDDGSLELITGSWWWSGIPHPPEPGQIDYLMYFRNKGDQKSPQLTRTPLPIQGEFPTSCIARANAVDWNADGLQDLVVSDSRSEVYVWLNVGSKGKPRWQVQSERLTIPWGFVNSLNLTAPAAKFPERKEPVFLSGVSFFTVGGSKLSPKIVRLGNATENGKPISHPGPGYGDPYYETGVADWDGDGNPDLFWGTQQGNLFYHRGLGGKNPFDFAAGEMMKLSDGQPLKVGPPVVDSPEKAADFTVLQGSRIVFSVVDFDGDGIDDLLVSDTTGKLFVFRNMRKGAIDALEPPVEVGKMPSRARRLLMTDWNHDGKPDLLTEGTAAKPGLIFINQSSPGKPALAQASRPFDLPYMWWGPEFGVIDWNGDGDEDLMVCSECFTFFVERSFLQHGYQSARLVTVSSKASNNAKGTSR
jgi:hypothetical protein